MKVHIYSVRNFVSLFNGREIFWLCHDASRWWQGHHHPTGSWQRSWEALRLLEIVAGCWNDVQDLLTSVNDPNKHIRIGYVGRPDAIWRSSRCNVRECRVPLPKESPDRRSVPRVLMGKSGWGNPDRNACHVSLRDVRHTSLGGGVPTSEIFCSFSMCWIFMNHTLKLLLSNFSF